MTLMRMEDVTFSYTGKTVLNRITLSVNRGEILSLLGPNGSGKTTLLKMMIGLLSPGSGQIYLEDQRLNEIPPRELARRIAYVPQIHRTAFAYRVLDVVLMGRLPSKPFFFRYSREDRAIALRALEQLSIEHLKDRSYTEISGGERQLTLIARALTQGADTFVLDEPVNGLDYGNQIRLLKQIADLARSGYTFIQTSHFPEHAIWISDRVLMLKDGQMMADGATDDVVNEKNLHRLYNTSIHVVEAEKGIRVCVPRLMRRDTRPLLPGEKEDKACYRAA